MHRFLPMLPEVLTVPHIRAAPRTMTLELSDTVMQIRDRTDSHTITQDMINMFFGEIIPMQEILSGRQFILWENPRHPIREQPPSIIHRGHLSVHTDLLSIMSAAVNGIMMIMQVLCSNLRVLSPLIWKVNGLKCSGL